MSGSWRRARRADPRAQPLMQPTILGEHPLARDDQGQLKSRIATLFLHGNVLITLPGIHATQRLAYSDYFNDQRRAHGQPPLTPDEEITEWTNSVDLIMEDHTILIRPDPLRMALAFAAADQLQQLVSKHKIRFLNVMNEDVRHAIKQRGECWRISALPRSDDEMTRMICDARISIAGPAVYYYSMVTGTRYLTYQEFIRFGDLAPAALARQLHEIREHSGRRNRLYHLEVDFFGTDETFTHANLAAYDFLAATPAELTAAYAQLQAKFRQAVKPELRTDDPAQLEWRNRMFSALVGQRNQTVADEILYGLSPEFFMQIQWLPGGRITEGEFIFDPIFDEVEHHPADSELAALCDEKATGFIFNFIRQFGDVEYINVGRVASSLSNRAKAGGRRGVYIAEIKQRNSPRPVARVIRLQKWDIADHLDGGKDLLAAILEAGEYTEFVLDRRLGCRQLGMNLASHIVTWRIEQPYRGSRQQYADQMIWYTYYERDYIHGRATDKIAPTNFQSEEFALRFARLLCRAAAPSLIVGKADLTDRALFDDGDEVVIEDSRHLPGSIMVTDHTGAFVSYQTSLESFAEDFARPVNRRATVVPDPGAFAETYLAAFTEQFHHIQQQYRSMKRGFDTLFMHHRRDEGGSFAYRWEQVLARLNRADAHAIAHAIRAKLTVL